MALKFHLDEPVLRAIAGGLRRRGIDVTTTTDAKLMSGDDLQHLDFARCEHRVIDARHDDLLILAAGIRHGQRNTRKHSWRQAPLFQAQRFP